MFIRERPLHPAAFAPEAIPRQNRTEMQARTALPSHYTLLPLFSLAHSRPSDPFIGIIARLRSYSILGGVEFFGFILSVKALRFSARSLHAEAGNRCIRSR